MNNISVEKIREVVSGVVDSDLGKSLGELRAIHHIQIDDGIAKISLRLIQPIHNCAEKINNLVADALILAFPGLESEIEIGEQETDLKGRQFLRGVKNIIAVASGKGGVGKSSIAVNLAAELSKSGARVGLLDGDVYGPSLPLMFGMQNERLLADQMPDGTTIAYPLEKHGIKVASMGFIMDRDQAAIVRGPMLAGYFSMLFEQLEWGNLDFLIFDLPPGTGDIQLTLTQKIPLTGAVIVTTPQEIAIADVRRSISMFRRVNVNIIGIIENMSYFVPPDMPDKRYNIFGKGGGSDIAKESGVSLLGEVPLNMAMRDANDGGMPVVLTKEENPAKEAISQITGNMVSEIRRLNMQARQAGSLEINI